MALPLFTGVRPTIPAVRAMDRAALRGEHGLRPVRGHGRCASAGDLALFT